MALVALFTQLKFSSHITNCGNVYTGLGGGGVYEYMRATSQVLVTGTKVNSIEDHKHLNPNHKQMFTP